MNLRRDTITLILFFTLAAGCASESGDPEETDSDAQISADPAPAALPVVAKPVVRQRRPFLRPAYDDLFVLTDISDENVDRLIAELRRRSITRIKLEGTSPGIQAQHARLLKRLCTDYPVITALSVNDWWLHMSDLEMLLKNLP